MPMGTGALGRQHINDVAAKEAKKGPSSPSNLLHREVVRTEQQREAKRVLKTTWCCAKWDEEKEDAENKFKQKPGGGRIDGYMERLCYNEASPDMKPAFLLWYSVSWVWGQPVSMDPGWVIQMTWSVTRSQSPENKFLTVGYGCWALIYHTKVLLYRFFFQSREF